MKDQRVPLAKALSQLHPSSIKWLIVQGYVENIVEDGEPGLRITDEGAKYFAQYRLI